MFFVPQTSFASSYRLKRAHVPYDTYSRDICYGLTFQSLRTSNHNLKTTKWLDNELKGHQETRKNCKIRRSEDEKFVK